MKLPQHIIESHCFCFSNPEELVLGMGNSINNDDKLEIVKLSELGLPPVCSTDVLATMLGINPGFVWSLMFRTNRHYRQFTIPKGNNKTRKIIAPKVGLKIIQKWLAHHIAKIYQPPDHVFGFVSNRSHIQAAQIHCKAGWIYSTDIENFFPSTPIKLVAENLAEIGYSEKGAVIIAKLFCFDGFLAQGAPSSPIMFNLTLSSIDEELKKLSIQHGLRMTRYADDIVFSGTQNFPEKLPDLIGNLFKETPWKLAEGKSNFSELPSRLKVHGLLVHGERPRLTKGYRNKVRAYNHLLAKGQVRKEDIKKLRGHSNYALQLQ